MDDESAPFRRLPCRRGLVQGLEDYAARLRGELLRAGRDSGKRKADHVAIDRRRQHYVGLLAHVEALGRAVAPHVDWAGIAPRLSAPDYRTTRSELRIELLRVLKHATEPMSVNAIHRAVIDALGLAFDSVKEEKRHRAVVVDALHALRTGPPSVIDCTERCEFGKLNQPEQRWYFLRRCP